MKQDPTPLDEARLHALVDGRLGAAEREELQALLAADPQAARTVQAWQEQREALRSLHADVLQEPVPAALAQAARLIGHEGGRLARWQRWGGLAASVGVAFVAGWLAHLQWGGGELMASGARPLNEFGRQALVAHVVYSPEVRHPVEVPAAQQEHLVQWLSRRLGRTLKVPDLSAQGYELVGGRLLPGDRGARAQFMYQNGRSERITLYVGAIESGTAGSAAAGETAFRFTHDSGAASFYWVDQGYGYALAGRLDKARLLALAESVYRQL